MIAPNAISTRDKVRYRMLKSIRFRFEAMVKNDKWIKHVKYILGSFARGIDFNWKQCHPNRTKNETNRCEHGDSWIIIQRKLIACSVCRHFCDACKHWVKGNCFNCWIFVWALSVKIILNLSVFFESRQQHKQFLIFPIINT